MGILQEILDHQLKFDNEVLDNNNLRKKDGSADLTLNYDPIRYQVILQSFKKVRLLVKVLKKSGYKWWKGQLKPLTQEDVTKMLEAEVGYDYDPKEKLSNVSMRTLAVIDEALEIEEAFHNRESRERLEDEFADLFHFVCSLGIEIGVIKEDQIKALYEKKLKVNYDRQSGIKKP